MCGAGRCRSGAAEYTWEAQFSLPRRGETLESFTEDTGVFWRTVTGDSQFRYRSLEKGVGIMIRGMLVPNKLTPLILD